MNETFQAVKLSKLRGAIVLPTLALLLALPVGKVQAQKKPAKTAFTAEEIMVPMDQLGPQARPVDLKNYAQVIHVAANEKHQTVAGALASIKDASAGKRYAVLVAAGTYKEV